MLRLTSSVICCIACLSFVSSYCCDEHGLPIIPGGDSEEKPGEVDGDGTESSPILPPGGEDKMDPRPNEVDDFTTPAPTLPVPQPTPAAGCNLPLYPATDPDLTPASGHRFGTSLFSRIEYDILKDKKYKSKHDTLTLDFKTTSGEGVLLYVAGDRHIDFIALYMKSGQLHYSYNCGSGIAVLQSAGSYNDGNWHTIKVNRLDQTATLMVDSQQVAQSESPGNTKAINVMAPLYLGGLARNGSAEAKINMRGINGTFEGCLRNFRINKTPENPMKTVGVIPCSDKVEDGVFFSANGGWIKARQQFRVGITMDIKMEIRPRNISGILLSVHSRADYLVLQMINGAIKFSVDNGKGAISATFNPPTEHYFCDGQWHSIQAVKAKNVVTLSVDKIHLDHSIGIPGSTSTDTNHPLFIGGHPTTYKARGLETREQFVGCIRNFVLNEKAEKFNSMQAIGNVTTSICPTI